MDRPLFWEPSFRRLMLGAALEALLITVILLIDFGPPREPAASDSENAESAPTKLDEIRLRTLEGEVPTQEEFDEALAEQTDEEDADEFMFAPRKSFYVAAVCGVLALGLLVWLVKANCYRILPTHIERWKAWGRRRYALADIDHIREQVIHGSTHESAMFYFVIDRKGDKLFRFTSGMPRAEEFAKAIREAIA